MRKVGCASASGLRPPKFAIQQIEFRELIGFLGNLISRIDVAWCCYCQPNHAPQRPTPGLSSFKSIRGRCDLRNVLVSPVSKFLYQTLIQPPFPSVQDMSTSDHSNPLWPMFHSKIIATSERLPGSWISLSQ